MNKRFDSIPPYKCVRVCECASAHAHFCHYLTFHRSCYSSHMHENSPIIMRAAVNHAQFIFMNIVAFHSVPHGLFVWEQKQWNSIRQRYPVCMCVCSVLHHLNYVVLELYSVLFHAQLCTLFSSIPTHSQWIRVIVVVQWPRFDP